MSRVTTESPSAARPENCSSTALPSADDLRAACANCSLRELCIPGSIPRHELEQLDSMVSMRRRLRKGQRLYNVGDHFQSLYAVRSGFFKTCVDVNEGRDQITGFQTSGELLGFDGLATEQHSANAIALEDSEVCILPFEQLEKIARQFAPLQRQLHRVMSREIVREHGVLLLLGAMKAEERVAAFLLNLAERYRKLGYSSTEFILRMTRQDIGSYLGLNIETVSRTFSHFHEQGLIEAQGKRVKLLQPDALSRLVSTVDQPATQAAQPCRRISAIK